MSVDRIYGIITSNSLVDTDEFEKWIGLSLKLSSCGNLKRGSLCTVFPS